MDIFFVIVNVIQKIWGNENFPNSLNVMVKNHYHSKKKAINRYLPYMYRSCTNNPTKRNIPLNKEQGPH